MKKITGGIVLVVIGILLFVGGILLSDLLPDGATLPTSDGKVALISAGILFAFIFSATFIVIGLLVIFFMDND